MRALQGLLFFWVFHFFLCLECLLWLVGALKHNLTHFGFWSSGLDFGLANWILWWKCFRLLRLEQIVFGVQSVVDTVGKCITSYRLAGPACLWCLLFKEVCQGFHQWNSTWRKRMKKNWQLLWRSRSNLLLKKTKKKKKEALGGTDLLLLLKETLFQLWLIYYYGWSMLGRISFDYYGWSNVVLGCISFDYYGWSNLLSGRISFVAQGAHV